MLVGRAALDLRAEVAKTVEEAVADAPPVSELDPQLVRALRASGELRLVSPSDRLYERMGGMVASPTPTVAISGDSTSTISQPIGPPRGSRCDKGAAVIQPAVPPPTMTTRRICRSLMPWPPQPFAWHISVFTEDSRRHLRCGTAGPGCKRPFPLNPVSGPPAPPLHPQRPPAEQARFVRGTSLADRGSAWRTCPGSVTPFWPWQRWPREAWRSRRTPPSATATTMPTSPGSTRGWPRAAASCARRASTCRSCPMPEPPTSASSSTWWPTGPRRPARCARSRTAWPPAPRRCRGWAASGYPM